MNSTRLENCTIFSQIDLPLDELACRSCAVVPRKALECAHCRKLYCIECAAKMTVACIMCKVSPWRPAENPTLNWLLGRVREPCRYCAQKVPRYQLLPQVFLSTLQIAIDEVREQCNWIGRYSTMYCTRSCEMTLHEHDCEMRPRRCGKRGCDFVAHNRNEALDHLRDAHAYYMWIHFEDKETDK